MNPAIERDFLDALTRIETAIAAPQTITLRDPALDRRRQLGTLRASVSAIADEAGHARRLIAQDVNCPYPSVRAAILHAIGPKTRGKPHRQIIDELRAEKRRLEQMLRASLSRNAELVDRLERQRVDDKLNALKSQRIASRPDWDVEDPADD